MSGFTFDTGGLIALDRNDRQVLTLVARAAERGMRITIPATALAQAIRNPARQARLCRLIRQPGTDLVALDGPDATAVGLLLARLPQRILWTLTLSFVPRELGRWSLPPMPTISGTSRQD